MVVVLVGLQMQGWSGLISKNVLVSTKMLWKATNAGEALKQFQYKYFNFSPMVRVG